MQIEQNLSSRDWDSAVVSLGAHPWQSAQWGDARREVDGVVDHRWLLRDGRSIVQMLRFEERLLPGLGKVAWVPRGPVASSGSAARLAPQLRDCLKHHGFIFAVTSPWQPANSRDGGSEVHGQRTIWLDLTLGKDQLWRNLHQTWRRNVGLARRENVVVESVRDAAAIAEYFELCRRIGQMKGFELRTSPSLILRLVSRQTVPNVEARLFVARCGTRIAAGALAFRCGGSIHYFGGGSDRAFTSRHPGEAVHWSIIEWGLSLGCRCYDLEGIDPEGNSGTYSFKKKMGGQEVALMSRQVQPLGLKGHVLAPLATYALETRWSAVPALLRSLRPHARPTPQAAKLA